MQKSRKKTRFIKAIIGASERGERTVFSRGGKTAFAIVPAEDAEYLQQLEDEMDLQLIAEVKARNEPRISWEDALKLLV